MSTVSKALLTLILLSSVSTLGQQPKPLLPDPKLTPGDVFDVTNPGYLCARVLEEGTGRASGTSKTGVREIRNNIRQ
jgi:hypothetical protein